MTITNPRSQHIRWSTLGDVYNHFYLWTHLGGGKFRQDAGGEVPEGEDPPEWLAKQYPGVVIVESHVEPSADCCYRSATQEELDWEIGGRLRGSMERG